MSFLHEGKLNNQQLCHSNYFEPPLSIKPQQFPVNQRSALNRSICGFSYVEPWLWNLNSDQDLKLHGVWEEHMKQYKIRNWNKQIKFWVNWTNSIEDKKLKRDF